MGRDLECFPDSDRMRERGSEGENERVRVRSLKKRMKAEQRWHIPFEKEMVADRDRTLRSQNGRTDRT